MNNDQPDNAVLDQLQMLGAQMALAPQDPEVWRMKQDLQSHISKFVTDASSWRKTSFEPDWHLFRRNADSIYDPALVARKEKWQSKAFMPMTASHRENIHAALFKMLVGVTPCVEVRARNTQASDQSANIRDLILREMEKSRFKSQFNMVLDDATTFGSGFARIRYETTYEDRIVRSPEYEALRIMDPATISRAVLGNRRLERYAEKIQKVQTYRGVRFEWLSIWDIFIDPKALGIKGSTTAYRFKQNFGDIVQGVKDGYYFPEAVHALRDSSSREIEPSDKALTMADRQISPSMITRTEYEKKIECFEVYARLPKKWVLVHGEQIDDPDELIPARVLIAGESGGVAKTLLCVEVNDDYEGEAPIYKLDYLPVADRLYGRGIPEMLKALQEVQNETVNQRIDNVGLVMNRMYGVIEKAVINRADFVSKPGNFIRLDGKYVQDIRQALMPLETPDITASAYKDVQELERYSQERTSSNRSTMGVNGPGDSVNKTATGLELLKQSAGEKFAYIGMLMEQNGLYDFYKGYWKQIYKNIQPDDVIDCLGPEKAKTFEMLTPEQIDKDYVYEPQGVFTMENRTLTQQRLQNLDAEFQNEPWFNRMAAFDKMSKSNNIDPETLKYSPQEMQTMMQAKATLAGQVSPDHAQSIRGMGAPPVPPAPAPGPAQAAPGGHP